MTLDLVFLMLLVGIALFSVFIGVRSYFVLNVRLSFINDETLWPKAYFALPSYASMEYNPRHWSKWTKAQWVEWINR